MSLLTSVVEPLCRNLSLNVLRMSQVRFRFRLQAGNQPRPCVPPSNYLFRQYVINNNATSSKRSNNSCNSNISNSSSSSSSSNNNNNKIAILLLFILFIYCFKINLASCSNFDFEYMNVRGRDELWVLSFNIPETAWKRATPRNL